jgi:hypothetical protein
MPFPCVLETIAQGWPKWCLESKPRLLTNLKPPKICLRVELGLGKAWASQGVMEPDGVMAPATIVGTQ